MFNVDRFLSMSATIFSSSTLNSALTKYIEIFNGVTRKKTKTEKAAMQMEWFSMRKAVAEADNGDTLKSLHEK